MKTWSTTLLLWSFSFFVLADVSDVTPQQLPELVKEGAVLVDVRTPEEYQSGHVPGAINIPLATISANNEQLKTLSDKTLVLYCRSGFLAGKAADKLSQLKFTQLKHLEGDVLGWQAAGLPLEKPE